MKNIFVYFFLLLSGSLSLPCFSQPDSREPGSVPVINRSHTEVHGPEYSFPRTVNEDSHRNLKSSETDMKDSVVIYSFNSLTDSLPVFKSTYEYDESGNNTLYLSYNWDESGNSWDLSRKSEYGYDAQGNLILLVVYAWNEGTAWVRTNKTKHSYDTEGNYVSTIKYRWNNDLDDWIPVDKNEILNSAVDTIIRSSYSVWDTINYEWIEQSRLITYSTQHDLIMLRVDSVREVNTDTWTLHTTEVYAYTTEGLLTSDERYSWLNDGSDSSGIFKYTYEYDQDARITLQTFFNWDVENDAWFSEVQQYYNYNATGQLAEVVRNILNETGDDWLAYQKWELSYTEFINIEAAYLWVEVTAAYEVLSKTFTYFRHGPGSVEPDVIIDFSIIPNPFNESILISSKAHIKWISIYTLQGLMIFSREYSGVPIYLPDLPDGAYLIRVHDDASVSESRLILKE